MCTYSHGTDLNMLRHPSYFAFYQKLHQTNLQLDFNFFFLNQTIISDFVSNFDYTDYLNHDVITERIEETGKKVVKRAWKKVTEEFLKMLGLPEVWYRIVGLT